MNWLLRLFSQSDGPWNVRGYTVAHHSYAIGFAEGETANRALPSARLASVEAMLRATKTATWTRAERSALFAWAVDLRDNLSASEPAPHLAVVCKTPLVLSHLRDLLGALPVEQIEVAGLDLPVTKTWSWSDGYHAALAVRWPGALVALMRSKLHSGRELAVWGAQ